MDEHVDPEVSILIEHGCWALLRSSSVGRLAVAGPEGPDIFPLNYVVDHGTVVFRTGEGTKTRIITEDPRVAFEVDGFDAATGEAWSVVIKGLAESISDLYEGLDALTLPLAPQQAGAKHRFVRIVPADISGRRFAVADSDTWRNPLADAHISAPE